MELRGGCFAFDFFDFFDFLERKGQQKCRVFDFPNFIKRVPHSRFDFSLMEIKNQRHVTVSIDRLALGQRGAMKNA